MLRNVFYAYLIFHSTLPLPHFLKYLFTWKSKLQREQETERSLLPAGLLSRWPQNDEMGQAEARSQECFPNLSHGLTDYLVNLPLIFLGHQQAAGLEVSSWDTNGHHLRGQHCTWWLYLLCHSVHPSSQAFSGPDAMKQSTCGPKPTRYESWWRKTSPFPVRWKRLVRWSGQCGQHDDVPLIGFTLLSDSLWVLLCCTMEPENHTKPRLTKMTWRF